MSRDTLKATKGYFAFSAKGLHSSEALAEPTNLTYNQLSLYLVPNTIVVGLDGVVEKAWVGPMNTSRVAEVSQYLGLPQHR